MADDREPESGPGDPDEFEEIRRRLLAAPSYLPEDLRACGQDPEATGLIRLRRPDGGVQLPSFQFDAQDAQTEPWPVVLRINELFRSDKDPWGVTSWWLDDNAFLLAVPADLLGRGDDDRLVAAAEADLKDD